MVIKYVKHDTAPAVMIEVENFDLTDFIITFSVAFTDPLATTGFVLNGTAEQRLEGKVSGNPPAGFMSEVGKFPAEIELFKADGIAPGEDLVQTFRGFYVRIYDEINPTP
jgi:hypothetical protein